MKIVRIESWREDVPLTRPYVIASKSTDAVELFFVRVVTDGAHVGLGSASPAEVITGESAEACESALGALEFLHGRDPLALGGLVGELETLESTPAARAAVDMALHDLFAKSVDVPLAELLGRCHESMPTSITIGIKGVDETVEEAREYAGRGFRHLKIKIGLELDEDIERLRAVRSEFGDIAIRVDANQGYTAIEFQRFVDATSGLNLEFVEQPLPAEALSEVRELPESVRSIVGLDENLHGERDAVELLQRPRPGHVWVIKFMKCGGIGPAVRLASFAAAADIELMWGCMDESAISIAAALHTAYASTATRYLDLDGSFDLARDPARGGFEVRDGRLVLSDAPGLGVELPE